MNIINRIDKCIDKLSDGKISSILTEAIGIALVTYGFTTAINNKKMNP